MKMESSFKHFVSNNTGVRGMKLRVALFAKLMLRHPGTGCGSASPPHLRGVKRLMSSTSPRISSLPIDFDEQYCPHVRSIVD